MDGPVEPVKTKHGPTAMVEERPMDSGPVIRSDRNMRMWASGRDGPFTEGTEE